MVRNALLILGFLCASLAAQTTQTAIGKPTAQGGSSPNNDVCPNPPVVRIMIDPSGLNAIGSIGAVGLPFLGNDEFQVKLDDPLDTCMITPGSPTWVLVADEPVLNPAAVIPNGGCQPGTNGLLYVNVFGPFHVSGPEIWAGPGMPACHTLPVPLDPSMCGIRCIGQGVWIDEGGPVTRFVLTEPLRMVMGS